MRTSLSIYSGILQLNHETFAAIQGASKNIAFALRLVILMGLIAGLGKIVGWRTLLAQPTMPDRVEQVGLRVDQLEHLLVETIPARIPLGFEVLLSVEIEEQYYGRVNSLIGQMRTYLSQAQTMANELAPPLGIRQSRAMRLFGEWLSTPFELLAIWITFALITLILVKTIGGTGTVAEHLNLMALGTAPYVLMIVAYMPDSGPYALATQPLGKMLALVALLWAGVILVKALTISHHISPWRAFAVLLASATIAFLLLPLATFFTVVYILL